MSRAHKHLVDWKRNNKIAIRNFSETCDLHDVVKLLLVRMLRRNYKDSSNHPIYTEFDAFNQNSDYPDIWMQIKGYIYVWEIQKNLTPEWKKQIIKKYEDVNLIIVDLNEIINNPKELTIPQIKKQLKKYLI